MSVFVRSSGNAEPRNAADRCQDQQCEIGPNKSECADSWQAFQGACMSTSSGTSNSCSQHTAMQSWPAMHQTDRAPAVEFTCTGATKFRTHSLVALFSAESELYALVKASAKAMGFHSVIRERGQSWSTVVCSDASEAFGCDTAPRPGETQTRGLQFLNRA